MVFSQLANQLHCAYCYQTNAAPQWPRNGDHIPFYSQTKERTDEASGAFRVPVHCPYCGKDWFVVWDVDPG